jgi:anti-sigma regulatory factor (Ser/Thr protein kinase)
MDGPATQASTYKLELPSDLDYVSPLRHFVAELARLEGFPKKFCFRTEILVDELCTNAVVHGPEDPRGEIQVQLTLTPERLDLSVQDRGGRQEKLDTLRKAVYSPRPQQNDAKGRGLVIVQMLSDELKLNLTDGGHTQIQVTKLREEDGSDTPSRKLLVDGEP